MNYKCGKIIVSGNFHMLTFTSKTTHYILKLGPILNNKNLITSVIIMSWLKCDSKFNFIRLCKYQCGVGIYLFW
jgi:hypothetical protein